MSFYPPCSHDTRPAKPMTAYRYFFHDRRGPVQMEHVRITGGETMTFVDLSEHMMTMWENLDADSKAYYQELQVKDQRRYMLECMVWEETRMKQEQEQSTGTTAA